MLFERLGIEVGQRFEMMTVLREMPKDHRGKKVFLLKCDCGNEVEYRLEKLRHHGRRSCGCLLSRHGCCGHPLYATYLSLLTRCRASRAPGADYYGGRVIKVC